MILYLDTSALVKKYFEEEHSAEVISAWKSALGIVTSAVAYAELLAAIYRKASETQVKRSWFERVTAAFDEDWSSFIVVEVNNRLNEAIHKVIVNHGLIGFDAIHLSSALTVGAAIAEEFILPATINGSGRPPGPRVCRRFQLYNQCDY